MKLKFGNIVVKLSEDPFCKNLIDRMYGETKKTSDEEDIKVEGCKIENFEIKNNKKITQASENIFVTNKRVIIDAKFKNRSEKLVSSYIGNRNFKVTLLNSTDEKTKIKVYYDKKVFNGNAKLLRDVIRAKRWSFAKYGEKMCKKFLYDILEPVMQQCLLAKGASFLHAASVEIDGSGMLLSGWGGAGKTSTASALISNLDTAKFMSDDLSIVDSRGKVYPYPKSSVVYAYNTVGGYIDSSKFISGFSDKVNWSTRKRIFGMKSVRRRVPPETLYSVDKIGKTSSKVEKALYLSRVNEKSISHDKISKEEMAKRSASVMIEEMDSLTTYVSALCSVGEKITSVHDLFSSMESNFLGSLKDSDIYSLEIPNNARPRVISKYILKNVL